MKFIKIHRTWITHYLADKKFSPVRKIWAKFKLSLRLIKRHIVKVFGKWDS